MSNDVAGRGGAGKTREKTTTLRFAAQSESGIRERRCRWSRSEGRDSTATGERKAS